MAGGNHPKGSTHKSRWEESTINKPPSNDPTPIPKPPNPPPDPPHLSKPDLTPPGAPLPYGFHMLDRRTFVHFDGSVISYFALPPNYPDFGPIQRPGPAFSGPGIRFGPEFRNRGQDCWNLLGVDGRGGENSAKRKFGEERERDWREEKEGRGLNPSGLPMGVEFLPEIGGGDELRAAKYMRLGGGGGGYENKYFDGAQVP